MHKVFISYHHANDQAYKEHLIQMGDRFGVFVDRSVDTGEISEDLSDRTIREKIRDEYLRDSTVTIVLVGAETRRRKHVDWEIYSSMYDGQVNKKSGIVVLNLPAAGSTYYSAHHDGEKERIFPQTKDWISVDDRNEYERRYPLMPDRIVDNLLAPNVKISVIPWNKVEGDPEMLGFIIEGAHNDRAHCQYDLSRPMRRSNS